MEELVNYILYLHILVGFVALITGMISITSTKGGATHKKIGKFYFYSMTAVFISGIIIAGFRFNRFLFLIAFLSYYSVFAGVRILKLKQLHTGQRPLLLDWIAGMINLLANVIFLAMGINYAIEKGVTSGAAILSIGFALGGLIITYANLKPFLKAPEESYHWYLSHIANMMGGYIATCTAFISTIVTRYDLMNPYLAFAIPSIIGVPLIIIWQKQTERKFNPGIRS